MIRAEKRETDLANRNAATLALALCGSLLVAFGVHCSLPRHRGPIGATKPERVSAGLIFALGRQVVDGKLIELLREILETIRVSGRAK